MMKPLLATCLIALGAAALPAPADAQARALGGLRDRLFGHRDEERAEPPERRGDQYEAYRARREGQVRSLREIEGQVIPRMPGATYLGPEFDAETGSYRLKFMRQGQVIWVDVDGRTGQVRGRSGY